MSEQCPSQWHEIRRVKRAEQCPQCGEPNDSSEVGDAVMRAVHKPFTDAGVTYCGWNGYEGCGEVWPCSTVRAAESANGASDEKEQRGYEPIGSTHHAYPPSQVPLYGCINCGCVTHDRDAHDAWHGWAPL